ncbi:MAG: hypothetical protein ACKPKO_26750, partial [Candidatus Fonsibacter sp.]
NLLTLRRHIVMVLRKRDKCRCVCKRWFTMHATWSVLVWQVAVMAQGIFPGTRHDRTAWT